MRRALLLLFFIPSLHAQNIAPEQIRPAATRAVAMVQKGSAGFYQAMTCFSCHDHGLPMMTFRAARERGIPVDEAAAAQVAAKGLSGFPDFTSIDRAVQYPNIVDPAGSDGWALVAAHDAGVKTNLVMAVYARRIANWQRADGHWPTGDDRPPQSYSTITVTAVAIRALQLGMPAQLHAETQERIARAKAWLLAAHPQATEESTYRLFGLHYAGAKPEELSGAVRELIAQQRTDGGWSELPHMPSDAYSTGEVLVALRLAGGVAISDAVYQKGLRYLLSTQDGDGVWHVHTRQLSPASVSPPYIETGVPYGHDQFISTDATCWAAMALMMALPRAEPPARPQPLPALEPKGIQPWMETALFGTAAELKSALDAGLDPNTQTPEGTTLLMMAAADAAKVKLLMDRGADARAQAKSGFTALIIASAYTGTSESVRLLLEHGAEVNPPQGVQYNASPLIMAGMAGDRENIRQLLAHGADANRRMDIIGMFPTSPLIGALDFGDASVVHELVKGGANVREEDPDKMTPLHWAVVTHHAGVVKQLIADGADVNAVDRFGFTPLMYAATLDFGDADTLNVLLQAGANPNVKDKDGKTPLAQARDYPYLRAALEKAGAK